MCKILNLIQMLLADVGGRTLGSVRTASCASRYENQISDSTFRNVR